MPLFFVGGDFASSRYPTLLAYVISDPPNTHPIRVVPLIYLPVGVVPRPTLLHVRIFLSLAIGRLSLIYLAA
jgi:hypothetical protein